MPTLVACRLASMKQTRFDQDNSRVCGSCGERVGIYPSGQSVLKDYPETEIVCDVCAIVDQLTALAMPAPGAIEEALEGIVKKRRQ